MIPDQLRKMIEKEQREARYLDSSEPSVSKVAPLLLKLWEAAEGLHKARHAWCSSSCPTLKALTDLEQA